MELFHMISRDILELINKEGPIMPIELTRKLNRSSAHLGTVKQYLITIGAISEVKKKSNYELTITVRGKYILGLLNDLDAASQGFTTDFQIRLLDKEELGGDKNE